VKDLNDITGARCDDLLTDAAARNLPAVLTVKVGQSWATFKSRLLGSHPGERYLAVEDPEHDRDPASADAVQLGQNIGVAFRRGSSKYICSTVVDGRAHYRLNERVTMPCLRLRWPGKLQQLQRRAFYRADVPLDHEIPVRFWDGGLARPHEAGKPASPLHTGRLMDISCGGVRVESDQDPRLKDDQNVGLSFALRPREAPIVLEAVHRHTSRPEPHRYCHGFQFVGLEMSVEGRSILNQISRFVSELQRVSLRRRK